MRVVISISDRSPNALATARYAQARGLKVVTFTDSAAGNPLRELSDIAFWLDSRAYNVVGCAHMI